MADLCFCHLNGYAVKDATARADIENIKTDKVSQEELTAKLGEVDAHFANVEAQITATNTKINYLPDDASELPYSNTTSGLEAKTVQSAIDEINNIVLTGSSTASADKITYDNTTSGMEATNVQGGMDELRALIDELIANSGIKYDAVTDKVYIKNSAGEWIAWKSGGLLKNYLYNDGDDFVDITGGYEALGISNSSNHAGNEKAPVLTMGSNSMNIKWAGNYSYTMGGVLNKTAIDLTEVNKLCVTYNASATGTYKPPIYFIVGTKNTTPLNNLVQQEILSLNNTTKSGTIEIDVSSVSGVVYYGVLFAISDGGNVNQEVNISSIWTE